MCLTPHALKRFWSWRAASERRARIKAAGDRLAFYVSYEWNGMGEEGAAVDEWERLTGPVDWTPWQAQ